MHRPEHLDSRRPIADDELPHLKALGARIAALRSAAGWSRPQLAERAQLSVHGLKKLERGVRRTRASTLRRLVEALAPAVDCDIEDLQAELLALAGPALAPESKYAERVAARRERRHRPRTTRRPIDRAAVLRRFAAPAGDR